MPKPHPTPHQRASSRVAGSYLRPLLELIAERGITLPALCEAAGLQEGSLSPPPEFVAAQDYLCLLDSGARLTQDPCFGLHVGERVKLGTYNVHGLMLLGCSDLGQALQQTLRYEGLAHDLGRSAISLDGGLAQYQWTSRFPHASHHLVESVFAGIRVFGNWLVGRPLEAAPVFFTHAAPADCTEHQRIFGSQVTFGAPIHCARFDAASLAWPLAHADTGVHLVLQQHADQLLKEKQSAPTDGGLVALVRATIVSNLAHDRVRLAHIAQDLHLSVRTLQRQLNESGTTYQQVLDTTRHALARDYLILPNLNLTDIAFLLGYRDQSAFNHAFKEWDGLSPGSYRDRFNRNRTVAPESIG